MPRQTSKRHLVIRSKLPTCAAATVNLADAMISDAMLLFVLPERDIEVFECSVGDKGGLVRLGGEMRKVGSRVLIARARREDTEGTRNRSPGFSEAVK